LLLDGDKNKKRISKTQIKAKTNPKTDSILGKMLDVELSVL